MCQFRVCLYVMEPGEYHSYPMLRADTLDQHGILGAGVLFIHGWHVDDGLWWVEHRVEGRWIALGGLIVRPLVLRRDSLAERKILRPDSLGEPCLVKGSVQSDSPPAHPMARKDPFTDCGRLTAPSDRMVQATYT